MRLIPVLLAISFLCACEETITDVAGVWVGSTTMVVDGEEKTVDLELRLTQTEKDIEGSLCWGEIDEMISSSSLEGRELFLESEWERGTIQLRGLVTDDAISGRFQYRFVHEREAFPALFEVTRR